MRPLVYLAGPFRKPDPVVNTAIAAKVGCELYEEIFIDVITPHLSMLEHLVRPQSDEYWLEKTLRMMRHCDAVFRIPGESPGSDAEEAEAIRIGIPVFYSRDALAEWVADWKGKHAPDRVRGSATGIFTDRDGPDGVG